MSLASGSDSGGGGFGQSMMSLVGLGPTPIGVWGPCSARCGPGMQARAPAPGCDSRDQSFARPRARRWLLPAQYKQVNKCGVKESRPCMGPGVLGCDGKCDSLKTFDCKGVCGGKAKTDDCGVCGGNNKDKGCDNKCFSVKKKDCKGVCGGSAGEPTHPIGVWGVGPPSHFMCLYAPLCAAGTPRPTRSPGQVRHLRRQQRGNGVRRQVLLRAG